VWQIPSQLKVGEWPCFIRACWQESSLRLKRDSINKANCLALHRKSMTLFTDELAWPPLLVFSGLGMHVAFQARTE
jgi:hypothetical protein